MALCAPPLVAQQAADAATVAKAKAIHAKVFSVDTHVDIMPSNFTTDGPNYATKLPRTQVDLVKMEEGGLSGAFLIVYVGQTPNLDAAGFARVCSWRSPLLQPPRHRLSPRLAAVA